MDRLAKWKTIENDDGDDGDVDAADGCVCLCSREEV